MELITSQGYPAETHYVTTSDGYVLALHRIPNGQENNSGKFLRITLEQSLSMVDLEQSEAPL